MWNYETHRKFVQIIKKMQKKQDNEWGIKEKKSFVVKYCVS